MSKSWFDIMGSGQNDTMTKWHHKSHWLIAGPQQKATIFLLRSLLLLRELGFTRMGHSFISVFSLRLVGEIYEENFVDGGIQSTGIRDN